MNDSPTEMTDNDRLELARWLIERYDTLRLSTANRAAIVVSADAFLLAGITFLWDKALSPGAHLNQVVRLLLAMSIGANFILVIFSIIFATSALAFVWHSSRESLELNRLPELLFFKPRDTAVAFNKISDFEEKFIATTKSQMLHFALGELLLIAKAQHRRYQTFRNAIRLLLASFIPFLLSIILLLLGGFL